MFIMETLQNIKIGMKYSWFRLHSQPILRFNFSFMIESSLNTKPLLACSDDLIFDKNIYVIIR